jgi:hypothetical protein
MAAPEPVPTRSVFRNRVVLAELILGLLAVAVIVVVLVGRGGSSKHTSPRVAAATSSSPAAVPTLSASSLASASAETARPTTSSSALASRPVPTQRPSVGATLSPPHNNPGPSASSAPTRISTGGACLPDPSACGYPDATNTGVPAGTPLSQFNGVLTVTTPGAVISGRDITGRIAIYANNVVIEDSRITTNEFFGIYTGPGFNGTAITDVTIVGSTAEGGRCDVGIQGGVFHATRVNVSNCSDGFHLTGSGSVVDSYFHNPYFTATSHNDGVQAFNGTGLVIRHNTIDMGGPRGNSCVFLQPTTGRIRGATIESNLLNGGGFSVYVEQSTGVAVSDNRIGHAYGLGWFSRAHNTHAPVVTGNIWDNSGAPVSG